MQIHLSKWVIVQLFLLAKSVAGKRWILKILILRNLTVFAGWMPGASAGMHKNMPRFRHEDAEKRPLGGVLPEKAEKQRG